MRSTPINIILAESGEMTLDKRRNMLALKYMTKKIRYIEDPILQIIEKLIPFKGFWNNGRKAPFIEAYETVHSKTELVHRFLNLPLFDLDTTDHIIQHNIALSPIRKNDPSAKIKFLSFCEENIKTPYTAVYNNNNNNTPSGALEW